MGKTGKKVLISVCISVLIVSAVIIIVVIKKSNDGSGQSLRQPPVIEFPEYGGEFPEVEYTDNINYDEIENEQIVNQYYRLNREKDDRLINSIKTVLGLEDSRAKAYREFSVYEDDDKSLSIYNDGSISYNRANAGEQSVGISDGECRRMAEEFAKAVGMDEGYEDYQVGDITITNNTGESAVIAKTVYLYRAYDNVSIKGNAPAFITYNAKGEITELYIASNEIGHMVEYKAGVTAEQAVKNAMEGRGKIDMPDDCDMVELKEVSVVYWEDSVLWSENDTLQPVYEIKGVAYKQGIEVGKYTAYEAALR